MDDYTAAQAAAYARLSAARNEAEAAETVEGRLSRHHAAVRLRNQIGATAPLPGELPDAELGALLVQTTEALAAVLRPSAAEMTAEEAEDELARFGYEHELARLNARYGVEA